MSVHLLSCIGMVAVVPTSVLSVVVLLLPLTWLQPHLCLFVELALLVDPQEFLCCLELNRPHI